MITILLADDQIPEPSLCKKKEIVEYYSKQWSGQAFINGFVFLKEVLTKLRDGGFRIIEANTFSKTLESIKKDNFDIAIIDLGWFADPDLSNVPEDIRMNKGWEIVDALKSKKNIPLIMFSNRFPTDDLIAKRAAELSIFPVYKSYDDVCISNLFVAIRYCIAQIQSQVDFGDKISKEVRKTDLRTYKSLSRLLIVCIPISIAIIIIGIVMLYFDLSDTAIITEASGILSGIINGLIFRKMIKIRKGISPG